MQSCRHYVMKQSIIYIILVLILITCFTTTLLVGNISIPLPDLMDILTGKCNIEEWNIIIREFRLPKAITAVLAGISLSVSGMQMQAIFRNPLAGPYVLGISAGASLGVAILIMGISGITTGFVTNMVNNWIIVLVAFVGAASVLFLIFSVSIRIKDIMTILILGMMIGSIISSMINVLQYFSADSSLKIFTIWMMGSLNGVTVSQLNVLIPCVLFGIFISLFSIKSLNAMFLGENYARSLGVNITICRLLVFLSTGILAGSITAFCGPIGFIGIAVPHICRILFRTADQRTLLFSCILIGPIIMLVCDLISLLPGNGVVLPINTVTAFIGIPIIIWIIIRNQKMSYMI